MFICYANDRTKKVTAKNVCNYARLRIRIIITAATITTTKAKARHKKIKAAES